MKVALPKGPGKLNFGVTVYFNSTYTDILLKTTAKQKLSYADCTLLTGSYFLSLTTGDETSVKAAAAANLLDFSD